MTHRPPYEDEGQFAVWRLKRSSRPVNCRSVVIAHGDVPVGESLALLLRLRGFTAVATSTMERLELMTEHWKPRALFIDTRLGRADDFRFVRNAASNPAFRNVLMVAMTSVFQHELPRDMRRIGFDGLCRRPCPVWQLAVMLESYFDPSADHS
ncbi:response regulator [Paraburkholderia rhynchosiae]|uniref:Response regulator receiver protein n=1 Tax=Paraburkholderia rhynchosiae TaxID=487049 RepID=A0A2N7WS50_9BURK|nr:response regulator [Paraburkholderia rhynchosiae]PMS32293.1 response regulator receiver protein [Paraburkholderia rhynchosiae]CAB3732347.1 hypothetical protein LMG27174_05919 [Paraburkholderia rhynchosiae]